MFSSESLARPINYTALLLKEQKIIFPRDSAKKDGKERQTLQKINPTGEETCGHKKRC